ncbi:MAG: U32 family peptidase [Clostridia bacterium]|nr:U32 family peptidase [Clostridia bacterium]
MKKIELLSPAGDFECLKAAIQNGANAVYLGTDSFNARMSANNFDTENLKEAVNYAHLRNVKINLTLNTLIKNEEFSDALQIAKNAAEIGVDAIIVQDLGLAKKIIELFPNIEVHASTQLTSHNLESVKKLEAIGFKRVVLSRELNIDEIRHICNNTNIEIEVFIHGALCISYSGQCLLSSMIGSRSGNRGRCAQACRLPYELLENDKVIDKGYLLSPKDLCSIDYLKDLIDAGVASFKIEGRMKKPEYVAIVTSIYRKYINNILETGFSENLSNNDYNDLLQVFNRGGFSSGHISSNPNQNLVFKEKQNNMGIYLGKVYDYNKNKGYVKLQIENSNLEIGDSVSINDCVYHVSELLINDKNVKTSSISDKITIGRMKGNNIRKNSKIYKIESKSLNYKALQTFSNVENIKTKLEGKIIVHKNSPITLEVKTITDKDSFLYNISTKIISDVYPINAINSPITKERIISQLSKTGNTEFEFENISVGLEDNLYISPISCLNDLRRLAISDIENKVIQKFSEDYSSINTEEIIENNNHRNCENKKISVLLNILNEDFNYINLTNIDKLYIPIKYFLDDKFANILLDITNKFKTYIFFPIITRDTFLSLIKNNIDKILSSFNISGFIVSNIGQLNIISKFNLPIISNYSFNLFNNYTEKELKKLDISTFTISPESDKPLILSLLQNKVLESELIVYGYTPVMNSNYCLIGNSNRCYKDCDKKCTKNNKYYLKDRMGFNFRVIPDNMQTVTTIYNSKILSILPSDFNSENLRIDILDEDIKQINNIIETVKSGNRLEGNIYTNGNLYRNI